MKNLVLKTAILVFALSTLTACGGGGGGGKTNNNQTATPLEVLNVSGATTTLEGTWQAPCDPSFSASGSDGMVSTIEFSGSTVTVTDVTWVGDPSCTGAPTQTNSYTGTGSVDPAAYAISGWANLSVDPNGIPLLTSTSSPDAADGSGPLADDEPYSVINLEVTSITGNPGLDVGASAAAVFLVDDTGSSPMLYGVFYDDTLGYVGLANAFYTVPVSTSSSINIVTASGGSLGLEGSWTSGCVVSGATSTLTTMSVTVNEWSLNQSST